MIVFSVIMFLKESASSLTPIAVQLLYSNHGCILLPGINISRYLVFCTWYYTRYLVNERPG